MSLRIGVILEQPLSTPCAFQSNCANRGYGVDIALMVCQFLNLTCTFSFFDSDAYGDVDNVTGVPSGMIGAIAEGRYDTSIPVLTPTFMRSKAVAFSSLYFYTSILFVTRAPESNQKFDRLSFAFQWQVWCVFILAFLACACVLTILVQKLILPKYGQKESIFLVFTDISIQLITSEFQIFITTIPSIRVIIIFWCTVSVVLMSAYTSLLCSQEVMQDSQVPFTDYESFVDCLDEGKCRIVVSTVSSSIPQQLQFPGSEQAEKIRRALERHPMEVVPEPDIPNRILSEKNIYLVWLASKGVFHYLTQSNKNCQFYTVEAPFKDLGAFAVRKENRSMLAKLDQMASYMRGSGLAEYIETKYYTNGSTANACHEGRPGIHKQAFINFSAMRSTFTFYMGGMAIGASAMVAEMISRRYRVWVTV